MSGLFHRLATRALGVAPVAEPMVAPLFAQGPQLGQNQIADEGEVAAIRPVNGNEEVSVTPQAAQTQVVQRTLPQVSDRQEARHSEPSVLGERDRGRQVELVEPRTVEPERRRSLPVAAGATIPSPKEADATRGEAQAQVATPAVLSTVPTGAERKTGLRESVFSAGSTAPVIRVSIGRIDVRAELPAPAPHAPPKQRAPTMSLDEYAKLRAEGQR